MLLSLISLGTVTLTSVGSTLTSVGSAHHNSLFSLRARPTHMQTAGGDDFNLEALRTRIKEVSSAPQAEPCRLLILDAMVPGQRLQFTETPPPLLDMLKTQRDNNTPMVMVGQDRVKALSHGVMISMEDLEEGADGQLAGVTLVAGDYVEITEVGDDEGSRWLGREGQAVKVSLEAEAPQEQPTESMIERCEALSALVDEWQDLVRKTGRERMPGQLDGVFADMGPMPPSTLPSKRALWVAGVINPLPALGVALEIRPACLCAETADLRVQVAEMGILDSIERLKSAGPPF